MGMKNQKTPSTLEQEKCFGRADGTGVLWEKDLYFCAIYWWHLLVFALCFPSFFIYWQQAELLRFEPWVLESKTSFVSTSLSFTILSPTMSLILKFKCDIRNKFSANLLCIALWKYESWDIVQPFISSDGTINWPIYWCESSQWATHCLLLYDAPAPRRLLAIFEKREFRCLLSPICHNHFWQGYTYFTFADGGGGLWVGAKVEEIGKLWGNHLWLDYNQVQYQQMALVSHKVHQWSTILLSKYYLILQRKKMENRVAWDIDSSLRLSFSSVWEDMSFSLHLRSFFRHERRYNVPPKSPQILYPRLDPWLTKWL